MNILTIAAAIAERDAAIERASKYQRTAAELSDKLNGTPCAEIRWQYERDALREALEPFADMDCETTDIQGLYRCYVRHEQMSAARAAMGQDSKTAT